MSSPSSNWIWLAGYLEISTNQHRIELRQALVLAGRCRESCEVLQEVLDRPDIGASWRVLGVRNQVGLDRSNYDAFWVWGFLSLVCLFWISIVSLFLQCMQPVSSSRWQEVLGRAVPCCAMLWPLTIRFHQNRLVRLSCHGVGQLSRDLRCTSVDAGLAHFQGCCLLLQVN